MDYGNGIRPTVGSASTIQTKFNTWYTKFYRQSGTLGRIDWSPDHIGETVSEGIGYGMLLMVFMSSDTRSYEPEFQKLWNYYQAFPDGSSGLMNWRIRGFSSVVEAGAATDAEMDVAMALVMAYYQFGKQEYLDDALYLIGRIRLLEVDGSNLLKPGNRWNDVKNPSYFSQAAIRVFAQVDTDHSDYWMDVLDAGYTMLNTNQNNTSGLYSDWSTATGAVTTVSWNTARNCGYDGIRTPWRVVWDYLWFGDSRARTMSQKTAAWAATKTASTVGGPISMYGSVGTDRNAVFIGGVGVALTASTNQAKLNEYYNTWMTKNENNYYFNYSLQLLYALLASGNMPNLKALADGGGFSSANPSSDDGSSSDQGTTADDCATVSGFNSWGVYVDEIGSSVTPNPLDNPLVEDGSDTIAHADFSIVPEPEWYEGIPDDAYPFVGLVFDLQPDKIPQDLSGVTSITLEYKSAGNVRFALIQEGMPEGQEYGLDLTPASTWRTETINISTQMFQPTWVSTPTSLNMGALISGKFELKEPLGGSGYISVRSLEFDGWSPAPIICEESSSDAVSSEDTPSSDAVSSEDGTSSDDGTSDTGNSSQEAQQVENIDNFWLWGVYVDEIGSDVSPEAGENPLREEDGTTIAEAFMEVLPEPEWYEGIPDDAYPFVGMIMDFLPEKEPADLSGVTQITLTYRSSGNVRISLAQQGITPGAEYGYDLPPSSSWRTITVLVNSEMFQPSWVSTPTPLNMGALESIKWELKEPLGGSGSIAIQNISFPGYVGPEAPLEEISSSDSPSSETPSSETLSSDTPASSQDETSSDAQSSEDPASSQDQPSSNSGPGYGIIEAFDTDHQINFSPGQVDELGYWYSFVDSYGSSLSVDPVENGFGDGTLELTMILTAENQAESIWPYVGVGFDFVNNGDVAENLKQTVPLGGFDGIRISYSSTGPVLLQMAEAMTSDGTEFGCELPGGVNQVFTCSWDDFAQPGWISASQTRSLPTEVTGFKFTYKNPAGGSVGFNLQEVAIMGYGRGTSSAGSAATPAILGFGVSNSALHSRNGQVFFSVEHSAQFEVLNIQGQILSRRSFSQSGNYALNLKQELLPGIYLLRLSEGSKQQVILLENR
jgi:endo-1,4-beta-D-glucanase Y